MHALDSWSSFESCTNVDEYDEKCRLSNLCKLYRYTGNSDGLPPLIVLDNYLTVEEEI